jgi:hypothetical protein
VWTWSSDTNAATHTVLPAPPSRTPTAKPSAAATPTAVPLTPLAAADDVLAALSPTTSVTSAGAVTVAHRAAYQLVIAPKDPASLVGSVRIALDAARHIPLRVQVFASGAVKPAFEIGFTDVSFAKPDRDVFTFNPPLGAKITQATPESDGTPAGKPDTGKPTVIGSGWTAVLKTTVPAGLLAPNDTGKGASTTTIGTLDALLKELPTVHGSYGTGRVLQTALFTALITDDGHLYIGSVNSTDLVAAANHG